MSTIKEGDMVRLTIDHRYAGEVVRIHRHRGETFAKVQITKDHAITERIGLWERQP
jgi:hypothetical protein